MPTSNPVMPFDEMQKLFEFAVENGILDVHSTSEQMQMKERDKILQEHEYKVWQGSDKRWRTHMIVDGKRKLICKTNRSDLENEIVRLKKQEKYDPTVAEIYRQWIDAKINREEIMITTKNRYDRQFERMFGRFGRKRIKTLTPWDVEQFILDTIHDKRLTQKGYSNMRILIYGIFRQAKKMQLINWSITDTIQDMEISRKSFRRINHEDDELVFQKDEIPKLMKAVEEYGYDVINLALVFLFKVGCRPGEITAITHSDLSLTALRINKTEIEIHDEKGTRFEIVDRTKTEAGERTIPVPDSASWIVKRIKLINPFGEYVFEKDGKRINQRQLRERLKILCKAAGIKEKSPNKIRKTYATNLLDQGVEKSIVTKVMGHKDISTTELYYHKNQFSDSDIAAKINAVNL